MSTEIDELEKRVARLEERLSPKVGSEGYDPTGEGSAYQPEPAPGSDAEHPPAGYILVPSASTDKIKSDWLVWAWDQGPWQAFMLGSIGLPRNQSDYAVSRPIPANEGDSRLAESVAIPVGWKVVPEGMHREIPVKIRRRIARGAGLGLLIYPDPSIPWGEGYEAILPSEAGEGDEYLGASEMWWKSGGGGCHPADPKRFAWRRRIPATTPTEPARDLSAEVERLEAECAELRDEIKQIKALEGSLIEAGLLWIGKTGISVSLWDRVLPAHKATHKLYIREVAG